MLGGCLSMEGGQTEMQSGLPYFATLATTQYECFKLVAGVKHGVFFTKDEVLFHGNFANIKAYTLSSTFQIVNEKCR